MTDRIREIRVQGMRCLANVQLELAPMTVLLGENGTGKSTIIAACDILRCFGDSYYRVFSSAFLLCENLREDCLQLILGVRIEDDEGKNGSLDCELTFSPGVPPTWGAPQKAGGLFREEIDRMRSALREIEVRRGANPLPRGSVKWDDEALAWARLGLGDIEGIECSEKGDLRVRYRGIPSSLPLSDGQSAFLAFVARGFRPRESCSLLVIDDPEAHLHSGVVPRVMDMLHRISERTPVLLATHSDTMLDCLQTPVTSAVLCELDNSRATVLRRPDPVALARWMERSRGYRGLGAIRAEGYEANVFGEAVANLTRAGEAVSND